MANKKRIAIASDKSGYPLKAALVEYLKDRDDVELLDFGLNGPDESEPYDEQAPKVAHAIQSGEADRGILICGTGQGMAIVANKHRGIFAVVADTVFAAERGKIVNNANVLTMGGWITAPFVGVQIARAWLDVEFTEKM
ncbi:MAG: RpiB/LacA/LacB family sugar-phosphate isomerase, partial [Spirochaetaceae bacterium]|nr:RpiB/LacA/LacB family sugar-phosphate isomerase [Spirochaetaceae bacterium]